MAETTSITRAEFFGTPVSVLDHSGRQWLTAEQAGLCLGYNPANARQGVLKIFERHQDEFTDADTCVVKLTTQGQARDIRIFSATGCNLLGFFTNTPRAKDFRVWAKQFLSSPRPTGEGSTLDDKMDRLADGVIAMGGGIGYLAQGMQTMMRQLDMTQKYIGLLEQNQAGSRRITPEIAAEAKALKAEGMNNADIGRLLRISRTAVSLIVRDQYKSLPAPDAEAAPSVGEIIDRWVGRHQEKMAEELAAIHASLPRRG